MKRNDLPHLLEKYQPTPEEADFKKQMVEFIQKHPDCFERSQEAGHITASAWLLDKTGHKALLMHHTKLNIWVQVGGHCDGNSDVLQAAIKEAQEESGISQIKAVSPNIFDIDIHKIPDHPKAKAHLHYDVRFLLQVASDEMAKKNHEAKELLWIDKNPAHLPTKSRSILRMFEKWQAYVIPPLIL